MGKTEARTLKKARPRRVAASSTPCSGASTLAGAQCLKSPSIEVTSEMWPVCILPITCTRSNMDMGR